VGSSSGGSLGASPAEAYAQRSNVTRRLSPSASAPPGSPYSIDLNGHRVRVQREVRLREKQAEVRYLQELRERDALRQKLIDQTLLDAESQQQAQRMAKAAVTDERRAVALRAVERANAHGAQVQTWSNRTGRWARKRIFAVSVLTSSQARQRL